MTTANVLADLYALQRAVAAHNAGPHSARRYWLAVAIERKITAEVARQARITAAAALIQVPDDEERDLPAGRLLNHGGKRIPDVYSDDEARQAHAMFRAGNEATWVREAELQYQRNRKRRSRERQIA